MEKKFVKIRFDVRCKWAGFPPDYRVFVNDELFTERTFIWGDDIYIKEMLQVKAEPGVYSFRVEELEPKTGEFRISSAYVEFGEARMLDDNRFEIL